MVRSTARAIVSVSHFMAWASSAIVVGISGYYIAHAPHTYRLIYYIVISALMLAFWLPSYVLPLMGSYRAWYLPLNFIWSYLWLAAFVFAAQDYNRGNCFRNSPDGYGCNLKYALEAFIFLAFFFTMAATAADVFNIHGDRDEDTTRHMEKDMNRHSDATGMTA